MDASRSARRRRGLGFLAAHGLLTVWAAVCLFPLYWALATSLKGAREIVEGPVYLPFVDFRPSLDAWAYILFDSYGDVLPRLANSALIGLLSTGLTLLVAALAAYALTRFRNPFPRRSVVMACAAAVLAGGAFLAGGPASVALATGAAGSALLAAVSSSRGGRTVGDTEVSIALIAPRILPPVAVVLPLYLMAQRSGLLDTRSALVATYTAVNLPVAFWLVRPILGSAPTEVEEAAHLDGASHLRILFTIVAPLAAPGLAAAGLLIFLLCWNEYLFAVYLGSDHAMTMPPFLAAQMSVREQQAGSDPEEWTRLSAAVVLMLAPLVVGTGLLQRLLARGALWTASAR